jgi:tetratricopeptide (TPR) repeat protein
MDAANTAMLQGQPHTALLLSLKAVQTCATNLVAQNNLAALLTQYGYPEQAIPFLQKINKEIPGNSTVLNNLSFAWLGLGETETAYQNATASVRHNPQHPQSRLLCGIILEKEGKTEEAKQKI